MDRLLSSRALLRNVALSLCFIAAPAFTQAADAPQVTPALTPAANATAQDLENQGDQLRAEKRYLDAVDYYQAAIAKHPSATLWNKTGMAYLFIQRYHEAQKAFDRAMKLDKSAPEAYNNRAFIEQVNKNPGKAIKYYHKALNLRPESPTFHYNLASAYFAKHEYELSTQEYRTAYQLDPGIFQRVSKTGIMAQACSPEDRAAFAFMVAKMYAQSGDFDRSILYLRKAMEEGYKSIQKVYSEPEFATLRTDKRFSELMSQRPQSIP
jgi:tetratricopeptide (TPR) repeat protein